MAPADPRVLSAARYWASRPGNHHVFHVFDERDARQEAALGLIANPRATWAVLYRRVLDAVRRVVPGYRQRAVPLHISIDEAEDLHRYLPEPVSPADAALLQQRAAMLDALPGQKRAMALHYVLGEDDRTAARQHGVKHWTWRKGRQRLFQQLEGL